MILLFGGTTEGRKAAEVLEEAGSTFYYSTKTGEQDIALHHGLRIDGAMDAGAMQRFCQEQEIRLIIDAAHPFAQQLHQTIADVAQRLRLPVVRYERIFPPRDEHFIWIDRYEDLRTLRPATVLATTGVQSISRLKPLETAGFRFLYRILPRESSVALAKAQGAADDQLCYYHEDEDEVALLRRLRPDILLVKESGESGGFSKKTQAARSLGITVVALKRPATPSTFHCVNGPHGLRRRVEQLLPDFFPLHSGLTTGTCATAAAVAATIRLKRGETPSQVPVILPDGETISVGVGYGNDYAFCIKDGGDDPDVTDGIEIRAKVEAQAPLHLPPEGGGPQKQPVDKEPSPLGGELEGGQVFITAGEGIGTITLPGFDYPPGSPAINRVPREMIMTNLKALPLCGRDGGRPFSVHLTVPQGAEIARRTFNPRLGIEGGISIIGVSGITKPFSEEAFVASIRKCMEVAKASMPAEGCLVINSGAKSEAYVKARFPELPAPCFVQYGNYIGATLRIAAELAIPRVTLCVMLGKAVKLAAGNLDTHSRRTTMDVGFVLSMLSEAGCSDDVIAAAHSLTLARDLWTLLPPDRLEPFARVVIRHCHHHCDPVLPEGQLDILLIDEEGHIYA